MMERNIGELVSGELDQCECCCDFVKADTLVEGICVDCVDEPRGAA